MIPDQKFNCPCCGAPGQTEQGNAIYSCQCRFSRALTPQPAPYYPMPAYPWQAPYYVTCGPNTSSQGTTG